MEIMYKEPHTIIDSIYLCAKGISKYLNFQSAGKKSTFQERSKSEKTVYCRILTIWHSGKGKTMETVKLPVVTKDQGGGWDEQVEQR